MLKQKRLRDSIGSLLVGQFGNYAIILVQIPYLTRRLSPEGFGVYAFANTLMMVGFAFIAYAVNTSSTYLFRKHAENPVRRSLIFWDQFGVQLILATGAAAILGLLMAFSRELRHDAAVYVILIVAFLFNSLYSPWVLAALEKFRSISVLITSARVSTLLLILLTVHDPGDVSWAFAAVIVPNAVIACGFWIWLLRTGVVRPIPPGRWKPVMVLKRDFFIALNIYAATAFSYIGIIIAKFMIDSHDYGQIAFADRFRWIAQVVIPTLGIVLFSRYCGERTVSAERGAAFGRKSAIALAAFGIVVGLGLALLLKPAILILGGEKFLPASAPLLMVAAMIPLIGINYYLTFFVVNVFDLGKQQLVVFVVTGGAVVLALMLKQHPTPAYIMAVIGLGELVRAIISWAVIHASGMQVFRPGLRREKVRKEA